MANKKGGFNLWITALIIGSLVVYVWTTFFVTPEEQTATSSRSDAEKTEEARRKALEIDGAATCREN